MASYSNIIIAGNVCRTPELKTASSGNSFTNLSIAVNSGFGDKKQTSFFDVVFFGKQAETICRFVQKGSSLLVDGTPVIERYTDKDGNNKSSFKITGRNFSFISSSNQASGQQAETSNDQSGYTREQFVKDNAKEQQKAGSDVAKQVNELFGAKEDDDLPF